MKHRQNLNQAFGRVFGSNLSEDPLERAFTGNPPRMDSYICFIEGDGDGDGDGAGGGELFTSEQKTGISDIVHKAMRGHLPKILVKHMDSDEYKSAQAAITTAAMEGATAGIVEQVVAAIGTTITPPGGGGGAGDDKDPPSFKDSQEYKDLMKRDESREARTKALEDERAAEKETAKRSEEKTTLETALRAAGVEETRIRGASALLLNVENVVQRDANGQMFYNADRGDFKEELTIEAGVKDYLTTDEGKALLPASGARGTGATGGDDRGGKKTAIAPTKMTKGEASEVLMSEFFGK